MKIHKLLIGLTISLFFIVLSELAILYVLNNKSSLGIFKKYDNKPVVGLEPPKSCETEESRSCANWFARYTHIDSSETVTKGVFSQIWESPTTLESRIMLSSTDEQYYVSFMRDVVKLKIQDSSGKSLGQSSLRKGDTLKIVEKYQKQKNNNDQFFVTIIREKS